MCSNSQNDVQETKSPRRFASAIYFFSWRSIYARQQALRLGDVLSVLAMTQAVARGVIDVPRDRTDRAIAAHELRYARVPTAEAERLIGGNARIVRLVVRPLADIQANVA